MVSMSPFYPIVSAPLEAVATAVTAVTAVLFLIAFVGVLISRRGVVHNCCFA